MNPVEITYDGSHLVLGMTPNWWVFAYFTQNSWRCPGTPDNSCFSGYYRVLAWK